MRFKIDENLPEDVASILEGAGYDAVTVLRQKLGGSDDARIAQICKDENRILMTVDTGFADIRTYPPGDYPGIIVLRLKRLDRPYVTEAVKRLLSSLATEQVNQRLWIVEDVRVRIRGEKNQQTDHIND